MYPSRQFIVANGSLQCVGELHKYCVSEIGTTLVGLGAVHSCWFVGTITLAAAVICLTFLCSLGLVMVAVYTVTKYVHC